MKSRRTNDNLIKIITTAIAIWMEHSEFNEEKFPEKYHEALYSQNNIRWNQLFKDQISQEWLQLHKDYYKKTVGCSKSPHYYNGFVWGASIVEMILRQIILLWDRQNKDIHGHTNKEVETLQKEKLIEKAREFHSQCCNTPPSNAFLFHNDFDKFTIHSTVDQILTWISSYKQAIETTEKAQQ